MASSPLLAALAAPSEKPKKVKDPKAKREKSGEKSEAMTGQQHGELPAYKEPTPRQRMKSDARDAKIHATRQWVMGDMTTKQHDGVHARANHVLTGKPNVKIAGMGEAKKTSGAKPSAPRQTASGKGPSLNIKGAGTNKK
jgi:hypothetical protein